MDLERIRQKFVDQLTALEKPSSSIEIDVEGDATDFVQGMAIHYIESSMFTRQATKIKAIYNALDKISNGDFGSCEECGKEISEKRLLVFPEATLCIICAEHLEKEIKGRCS